MNEDLLFKDAFLASVYDAWYPSEDRQDYAFYMPYAVAASCVVDIGCGTGTFLRKVRASAHLGELTGIDPNPGVIELARRYPDIDWIEGRVEDQSWSEKFDLAIMTGHAFQTILGRTDMKLFLDSVAKSLQQGGLFAFESRNPHARAWEIWRNRPPQAIEMPDGNTVTVTTNVTSDFDGETVSFVHTFTGSFPGSPLQSESTLQFWDVETLQEMLQEAGFVVEAKFGDFAGSDLGPSSPEIVMVSRRC